MKFLTTLGLEGPSEIDQQILAADHVHVAERGINAKRVPGENDAFAQVGMRVVKSVVKRKKSIESLRRHRFLDASAVKPGPGFLNGPAAGVGCKHLQRKMDVMLFA